MNAVQWYAFNYERIYYNQTIEISTNLYSDMSQYASIQLIWIKENMERTVLICSDFSALFQKCLLHNGCRCILSIFLITEFIFRWTKDSFVFYSLSPTWKVWILLRINSVDSFKNQLYNCGFFKKNQHF